VYLTNRAPMRIAGRGSIRKSYWRLTGSDRGTKLGSLESPE
jgi:hypothetical protein